MMAPATIAPTSVAIPSPTQKHVHADGSGHCLDVTHALFQFLQLLLEIGMFLGHFLVLALPFVSGLLESLNFAFVMSSLDIGLSKPED